MGATDLLAYLAVSLLASGLGAPCRPLLRLRRLPSSPGSSSSASPISPRPAIRIPRRQASTRDFARSGSAGPWKAMPPAWPPRATIATRPRATTSRCAPGARSGGRGARSSPPACRISESSTWDSQITFFPRFDDPDDYRVHSRVGLQAAINRHLGIRLGNDLKYDHEPVRGFRSTDTTTNVSLVVQLGHRR